jgi:glycosyltransferase 2 family protein
MDAQTPAQPRRLPRWLPQAVGYAISVACLIWVLHGYPIRDFLGTVRTLDWRWVAVAMAADLAVYLAHAWRWRTLLAPAVRLSYWRTVQSIYIGLFANEILPLRTGEVIRCYLLAHWNGLRISLVFASAAVERLFDGLWMVLCFVITAYLVKSVPEELVLLVYVLAALILAGASIMIWVVGHHQHAHAVIRESRWAATLRHVIEGLRLMGNPATMVSTGLISLLYLALQVVSVYALMLAYGMDLSFWVAGGVLALVRFATVVPNAPGNVGLFQVACVLAMGLFDVEQNDAKTFSFIMFFALTLPLLAGGALATAQAGLNLDELRERARRGAHLLEEAHQHHYTAPK